MSLLLIVCGGKYVPFGIICSIIVDTFEVDPHSIQYEKCLASETDQYNKLYTHMDIRVSRQLIVSVGCRNF